MKLLVEDLKEPKPETDLEKLLIERGATIVAQSDWEKINAHEVATGEPLGKPRVKLVSRTEMLGIK